MQGTVLAGLKCSISIDSIGKECLQNVHPVLYKYKNTTSVPPLSLIDDIIAVSSCSSDSVRDQDAWCNTGQDTGKAVKTWTEEMLSDAYWQT